MEKEVIERKKEIIEIDNFEQLKNSLKAKESKETGGLIEVSILRHCQPLSDDKDALLSQEGEDEAKRLAGRINSESQIVFIYSPLPRARKTAEILSKNIQAQKIYLMGDERLGKPSWNSSEERRFSKLADKLYQKPGKTRQKFLQMFYGVKSEKAMAQEPVGKLDDFLNDCVDLALKMSNKEKLKIIAISHQETMVSYLIRRWNLPIGGPNAWEGWYHLKGIKTGDGFKLMVNGNNPEERILEVDNQHFSQNFKLNDARTS
jgi:broad specificity phosphatase PhoE